MTLHAVQLPQNVFGYFLTSQTQGFIANPAGSAGNLCVAGSIGRYVVPGQIQSSGSAGMISLPIHPMTMPQPNSTQAALPGETWNFTCWFRDVTPQGTSNFTNAFSVNFTQ